MSRIHLEICLEISTDLSDSLARDLDNTLDFISYRDGDHPRIGKSSNIFLNIVVFFSSTLTFMIFARYAG